jgi:histidinol phosphatase-like PHP family hydrolase
VPDVKAAWAEYRASNPGPRFHFGVELSCVSEWELREIEAGRVEDPVYGIREGGPTGAPLALGVTAEDLAELHVEYVVAGTHWLMYVPFEREAVIRDYHRQNLFLACHPLVDIVAHPGWWMGHWADADGRYTGEPWFDDFGVIPRSIHEEFGAAARENGKVVEINLDANLLNAKYPEHFVRQYVDYLAGLKSAGVRLSIGSDCHDPLYEPDFAAAERLLDSVGIGEPDLWTLPPREGSV